MQTDTKAQRLLLLIDRMENRALVERLFGQAYHVITAQTVPTEPFDLCIIDGPALDRVWVDLQSARSAYSPVILPVLLRASRLSIESEQRYHTLADACPACIWIDQDERLVYANPAMMELLGTSKKGLTDIRLFEMVHPEDHQALVKAYKAVREGGPAIPVQVRVLTCGMERWLEALLSLVSYRAGPAVMA
ncbi:MAG: PAS domain S-box protein [Sedimentisphaerales bacterium]|jgi:PAS domain S-box-containing protein|nr:PAS domain S-box protein [Sedimentisphaerales bacterium]